MTDFVTTIAENVARVRETITDACTEAGRDPASVLLIAVSKTKPAQAVLEAAAAGVQHFGENRVEEGEIKIPQVTIALHMPVTWHMVGHVQSRKARDVAPLFDVVHSVDSEKLAAKLSAALPPGKMLDVLLEMNVSGEASKAGLDAANWERDAEQRAGLFSTARAIAAMPNLRVRGLMTVAPLVEQAEAVRPVFISLRQLRDALEQELRSPLPHLSMGMTDDYPTAIAEGATMIRIGRAIFGARV